MVGGILEIKMGNKPNKLFGAQLADIPNSMSSNQVSNSLYDLFFKLYSAVSFLCVHAY